jgi:trehalose 6-phosphate phosphatase
MSHGMAPPHINATRHAFFLDLDGTLAPIVDDPAAAALTSEAQVLLARLVDAAGGAVAILSGRSLAEVDRLTAPLRLAVGGSHGLELRRAPDGMATVAGEAGWFDTIRNQIEAFAAPRGLLVEAKTGAIALHYRQQPEQEDASRALIDRLAATAEDLRALHGKMVSEITHAGADKGTALQHLAQTAPFAGRVPVMIGDDVTDEDGFDAAQRLEGFGVKIGDGRTAARYRVASMDAALAWLSSLVAEAEPEAAGE